MSVPFTQEQFLDGFGRFNAAVWPLHLLMIAVAAAALALALRGGRRASRGAALGLAALWTAAAALQATAFRGVMAPAFSAVASLAFLAQAALLAAAGFRERLVFRARRAPLAGLGLALVAFAAVLYPALALLAGERYPRMPVFGVAPCPNTIFTFGLLLLADPPVPWSLLAIPIAWSVMGVSAAANLGVIQDWGLPAAAVVTVGALALRARMRWRWRAA